MTFGPYQKLVVALFGAVVSILSALAAGVSPLQAAIVGLTTFGTAAGIWAVPNQGA